MPFQAVNLNRGIFNIVCNLKRKKKKNQFDSYTLRQSITFLLIIVPEFLFRWFDLVFQEERNNKCTEKQLRFE